ncbi:MULTISPECIES: PDC sensor domain-containing protein [unclassified Thalassospira]|uniref:PDC sensor domain-containing protein n=1 Tax=unclassified Thalassospira TaxID=2648997 RepID=UPI001AEFE6CF|nr:PDC sensor domain-containing protein [Thalassospira sp. MCCC 1A01428]
MSFKMKMLAIFVVAPIAFVSGMTVANANEFEGQLRNYADDVKAWLSDPLVIDAVKAQNAENAGLSQDDIDKLDKEWRAETSATDKPLIDKVLARPLSKFLREKADETEGLITEIFVMDNKGLNVGQSDVTSDYWQGDEAKWQKTFPVGPDAIHMSDVELDESTQTYQSQLSLPVIDSDGTTVIGAVTVGINVELLE